MVELTTDTYVDVSKIEVYNESDIERYHYHAGDPLNISAWVYDPFGSYDILGANITIKDPNGVPLVDDQPMVLNYTDIGNPSSHKIFEYTSFSLPTSTPSGTYTILVTGIEGNDVRHTKGILIYVIGEGIPEFSDVHDGPDPQFTGQWVNITVNVTDDNGVFDVWVNITYPDSTWLNSTMEKGAGDLYFFNGTFIDVGTYDYTIYALDTSNN